MTKFNWFKALGFAGLIWAIMFAVVWATIGMGIFGSVWTQIVLAIIAGSVTYLFAMNARSEEMGSALGYGAVFAAVGIVLDLLISQTLVPGLFHLWAYYLAYAFVLFAPSVQLGLGESTINPHAV